MHPGTSKKRRRSPTPGRQRLQGAERRLRNALRRLARKLFHLEDDERRRWARELRDIAAQTISAMIMDLGVISRSTETLSSEGRTAVSECISLARVSLQDIRTFAYQLHPPMIDDLGLVSAFRIYVEDFSRRSGMRVDLELPASYRKLSHDLEITLFRVLQEGLINAARRSGKRRAKVTMNINAAEIRLNLESEMPLGSPLVETTIESKVGVGLSSVQERVRHFGGKLTFHSDEHRTVLETVFPFSPSVKRPAPKGAEPRRALRNSGLTQRAG